MGVRDDGVAATGTVTVADYTLLAGDTFTIDGNVLTEGSEWTAATSNDATATSLAGAIDALPGLSAVAVGAVITITADPGLAGNVAMSTSDGTNLTLSGAALTGGTDNTIFTDANYDYTPIALDKFGRLKVIADLDVDFDFVHAEDSAHTSGDLGSFSLSIRIDDINADNSALLAGTNGDYQAFITDASGALYVVDAAVLAQLVTMDAVLDLILVDTNAIVVDLAAIEVELLAQGITLDAILVDTNAIVVDLAAIEVELLAQGVTLDAILVDTSAISATLTALSKAEDSVHVSGDQGIGVWGVRNDSGAVLAGDGDYIPFSMTATGDLRVTVGTAPDPAQGTEAYTVTDALAAAGDGLQTITAAATPWITVASLAVGAGVTAYMYAYQWACDQNAAMRIISDDTADIIVYKHDINQSTAPGTSESWGESGRIEIAGAANLEIKMQIKKRRVPGGDAEGSGSMHIRTL